MTIRIYESVMLMDGIGEEWLTDAKGNVIAVFIDGKMTCEVFYLVTGNNDVTKVG